MANLSTSELSPSERSIVHAMQKLGFGHFEGVRIVAGELTLDPWPKMMKSIKCGAEDQAVAITTSEFQLKRRVMQFIERVRSFQAGVALCANIDETLPAVIINEQGGKEKYRERNQDSSSFYSEFAGF